LIGDIPLFVGHQSADVWAHSDLFKLDADGNPAVVAGVPPDYFSKTGQVWGVPVYNWEELQKQNYGWWIERLRAAFGRFDLNRLDHFIGFVRTYEVPAHAKTAEKGQYQAGGGKSFLNAAAGAFGRLPLIVEDLGIITPEVAALRDQFQLPGIRVLQFDLEPSPGAASGPPEQRPVKWLVYTGTHDNDTTAGWYGKLPEAERDALRKRLGVSDGEVVWAMIREAFASQAEAAIIPAQDLLELGSEARMNFPGTAEGNWGWRLKDGALTPKLARRLKKLTETYGRLNPAEAYWVENSAQPIAKRAQEAKIRTKQ
jgi:4-alpha-glucanotransferase